jgi:hypothetical protein
MAFLEVVTELSQEMLEGRDGTREHSQHLRLCVPSLRSSRLDEALPSVCLLSIGVTGVRNYMEIVYSKSFPRRLSHWFQTPDIRCIEYHSVCHDNACSTSTAVWTLYGLSH